MCGTTRLYRIESILDSFTWQIFLSTQPWLSTGCIQIWDQLIATLFNSCHIPRKARRGKKLFCGDVTSSFIKERMEGLVWLVHIDSCVSWLYGVLFVVALPFTKNPEANPTFRIYFSREWYQTLNTSLRNFFSTIFTYLRILNCTWPSVIMLALARSSKAIVAELWTGAESAASSSCRESSLT